MSSHDEPGFRGDPLVGSHASTRQENGSIRKRIVLAITGASGAPYAIKLLQVLCQQSLDVHLVISSSGAAVIQQELGHQLDLVSPDLKRLIKLQPAWSTCDPSQDQPTNETTTDDLHYHRHDDFMAPIASGSFRTDAMVICPCSGTTLSGIAHASAANLIQRAAEVHLKEQRKLILVPRETPLSTLQLKNLHRVSKAGAVVLPAMPGWYHEVKSLDCLVDFIVSRILDQLGINNSLMGRWGE